MVIHPRNNRVQQAGIQIKDALTRAQEEHDLTDIEMMQVLFEHQMSMAKYMLRSERHPDDPERSAHER